MRVPASVPQSLVAATLTHAAHALKQRQSFFAALLTTGTHHPYTAPAPSSELDATAQAAEPSVSPLYGRYLDRVRESDDLAREIYEGLQSMTRRLLFIVVGDHGEVGQSPPPRWLQLPEPASPCRALRPVPCPIPQLLPRLFHLRPYLGSLLTQPGIGGSRG